MQFEVYLELCVTGSGQGQCPSALHCSAVCLCVSTVQTSLMVFTQVDIWSNQKAHDKQSTSCQCSKRGQGDQSVTEGRKITVKERVNDMREWQADVTDTERNGEKESDRERFSKAGSSYIFIQVGLLQVDHFKLDSLQNLFQRLTCFVVQLLTWSKHTSLVNAPLLI